MDSWRQVVAPTKFTGREWFFQRLETWLADSGSQVWLLQAEPGYGKTRLVQEILQRYPEARRLNQGPATLLVGDEPDLREYAAHSIGKTILFSRPNLRLASWIGPGVQFDSLDPMQLENITDLAVHLSGHPRADSILRSCGGNFGVAELLAATPSELDVLRSLWQLAEDCLQQSPNRDLSSQILTLLGETGGPLEAWRICDFLGTSAMRVRQALTPLEPILKRQEDRYQVFTPWLGQAVTWSHFRDLEVLHASVITYFRETYPSWEEMSDPYGWDYLVHHCDRFARTARKKDFSVLHWLGEGPFLRQKLRQGGKLPGVLRDLERCLTAAMEESDLSRIAFYAFQLPRVRQERLAGEMHKLADLGQIESAHQYALLIPRENHKLLALLLLAWQAVDERRFELADRLLTQAIQVDTGGMFPELNLLIVSICACLLKGMPAREKDILELLSRDDQSGRAASNYLTLGLIEGLEDRLRNWVLRRGWNQAPHGSGSDQQRLSTFIGQSLRALKQNELAQMWSGALTRPAISQEDFDGKLKELIGMESEVERLDQLVDLADQITRQQPSEWLSHAVGVLTMALQNFAQPECWLRGFAQLSRLWMTLGPIPEAFEGLERLTQLAKDLDLENQLRVRIVADLALGFYRLGDSTRSQQLISKAAAGAVSEVELDKKTASLAFVGAATAQLNHPARARDLAFTLLEALEPPPGAMQDHFCRLTFRLASNANGSPDQLRQALGQDQRELVGLGNSPRERAYLLLGLARAAHHSGDGDWADQLMQQAAVQAHLLVVPKLKAWTLADLACLAWDTGQHERYRAFLQEAEEILATEKTAIHRLEGMVDLCRALGHSKDRRARSVHREILQGLHEVGQLEVCLSSTLPRLLPLLQETETRAMAKTLLEKLRHAPPELNQRDRDLYQSGLLHLELAFGEYDNALSALTPVVSPQVRSQALVDLAVGLTARDPREGLAWLPLITRQPDRLRAIRLILSELGAEKRPWRRQACHEALQQLTVLAQEDEATMDLVVSYWLTRESDRRKFEATGKRLGWIPEPAPMQPLVVKQA
ncbi:MAG: hypothetical protein KF760_01970 [Candidatus Eremiobacteraeota bacterium]|nr:hypothetical protein [Candidatus Eremiobacteraeota bacterium]MCW5871849.1 hypothetical protein [Candidatus Eremiobacteraeota bacterium]